MEEEEILQYISTQRGNSISDDVIGMQLQMKGVSNWSDYLKKKDDTSISPSTSGEEGTESAQSTVAAGGQEAGSSDLPQVGGDTTSVNTLANGEPDLSVDPITGNVITPWTDTPQNRARLEIDPVHYDAYQKTGFIKMSEKLEPWVTPEMYPVFQNFASSGDWWMNTVYDGIDGLAVELAKNDEYLAEIGVEINEQDATWIDNPYEGFINPGGGGITSELAFFPSVTPVKTEEQMMQEKVAAVKTHLFKEVNDDVAAALRVAMPADIRESEEAMKYMEQHMLEQYGSMVDLTGEGRVGNTPVLQFNGWSPIDNKFGAPVVPKFSGYLVDKFEAAGIDLVNAVYNLFGDEADVIANREKAEEIRRKTLQFTETMSGSFADGEFGNGLAQLGGFVSESTPTMMVMIPAAAVTGYATRGKSYSWWLSAGLIGLEGATLSTSVEAARTRQHPMFKRYTKDGVTIGHYEMMEITGGDPELIAEYEYSFDEAARFGHLSTVFGTDFVANGASSLFFLKALKGAGSAGNVGPNMTGWWNAHLANLGYSIPVNGVTSSITAMTQYVSMMEQSGQEYEWSDVEAVGMDVALGGAVVSIPLTAGGSAINYVQTKGQIVNALSRDAVGRNGGNIKIHQQRKKYLEILRNSTDKNEQIHAERMLVDLEEQRLSTMAADEQFYLRMNPEDYENIVGLHREYNSKLHQLNSLDDPNSAVGRALQEELEVIKDKRINIEKMYEVDPLVQEGDPVNTPPPDLFEPTVAGPDGNRIPLGFEPSLAKWWYVEFFDKYADVNMLQRSIMEALDTENMGKRVELSQDFEVLQKLSTSKAAHRIDEMTNLRQREGGLYDQLRHLQKTIPEDLYSNLPEVYDKNAVGLYDRYIAAKWAPKANKKALADNEAELSALKAKDELTTYEQKRIEFLEEKIAERKGSGMTDEESANFLNSLPDDLKLSFDKVREEHRLIQQDSRDAALEYGLIDKETYNRWMAEAEDYITLTGIGETQLGEGIADADISTVFPQKQGQEGTPSSFLKRKGRSDETGSLLAKTIQHNTLIHAVGQKNVALRGLYELALNNPNDKVYTISDAGDSAAKNTVMLYVDGEAKYITFANKLYAKPFKTQSPSDNETYIRWIQPLQRLASTIPKMYTQYSTTFWAGNSIRDYQSSIVNAISAAEKKFGFALYNESGQPINIAQLTKDSHLVGRGEFNKAFKAIAADEFGPGNNYRGEDGVLYQEYKSHGGKTGWAFRTPLQDIETQLRGEIDAGVRGQKATKWMYDNTFGLIESFNNTFENVFRFQVYKGLRKQGVAPDYAASVAKDVSIDFNRSGNTTPMLSSMKFFLNAGLQGADMTYQTSIALKPKVAPDGTTRNPIQRLTGSQKLLAGAVGFSYMLTTFNQAVSETDTDGVTFYDKIPDEVKQRNHVFMIPGSPTGEKVLIPKTYGFGMFNDMGTMIAEVSSGERDVTDGAWYFASSAVRNMSPVHFGAVGSSEDDPTKSADPIEQPGLIMKGLSQIDPIQPIIAMSTNVDNLGNPISADPEPGTAKAYQGWGSPEAAEQIAQILNSATGTGSENISGPFDFNPDKLNYLLTSYLGSSYTMFGDAADGILAASAGQENLDTWPMIKKFYSQDYEKSAYANYFNAKTVVNSYLTEFGNVNDLLENKDKPLPSRDERILDYEAVEDEPGGAKRRYGGALAMAEVFRDIDAEMVEMREAKNILQEKQDDLNYHMFNLEVADEWGALEDKIYKIELAEMKLMEKALKQYYKFYNKPEE